MNGIILLDAIEHSTSNIKFNTEYDKQIFIDRLYKYVQNDENNYKKILTIVEEINWVENKEINDFFISYFKRNYSSDSLFLDFKEKTTSSSSRMIALISGEGLCEDSQVIKLSSLKEKDVSENNFIYILDDYIGSGKTIIEGIEKVKQIIKKPKIKVVSYICQKKARERICNYDSTIEIFTKKEIESYKEKYQEKEINYIESVCRCCKDPTISFGYNNAGAYIVLNGIAPNSDISMLWAHNILYNNKNWMPLFDREVSLDILNQRNRDLIKKKFMLIKEKYKVFSFRSNISYEEFEFLIYTFGGYFTKDQLLEVNYFDSEEELDLFINSLLNNNYIDIHNGYIIISNSTLYQEVKNIFNHIFKEKALKKITSNF